LERKVLSGRPPLECDHFTLLIKKIFRIEVKVLKMKFFRIKFEKKELKQQKKTLNSVILPKKKTTTTTNKQNLSFKIFTLET